MRRLEGIFMSRGPTIWKTLPRGSFLLFMLGVFFLFLTIGIGSDIMEMGRQPRLFYALSLLIAGVFPVCYATAGFALRGKMWKVFLPVFALHMTLLHLLNRALSARFRPVQMNAGGYARLQGRLAFDALA